jgi:hypothetical protein
LIHTKYTPKTATCPKNRNPICCMR